MNMCRHHHIELWNIEEHDTFQYTLKPNDFKRTQSLVRKTGIHPHIQKRAGLPFVLQWCRRNITFCSGFILFLGILALLSSYVWEISFQGQSTYTKETLHKTVTELGVTRGMKRSKLVCDDIEKSIRSIYPDISWVSAEEVGSRLVISIKEAEKTVKRISEQAASHVTAPCDGVIREISVNRGVAAVKKGENVKKGQILISGVLPITDDADVVVKKNAVAAKGDVTIQVTHTLKETISSVIKEKEYTGKRIKKYIWKTGNRTFSVKNPFKRFHNSLNYDIITTEKLDTAIQPLNFPIHMTEYEYREYRLKTVKRNREQIKKAGEQYWEQWQRKMKKEGIHIQSHSLHIEKQDEKEWRLVGTVTYTDSNMKSRAVSEAECQVERKAEEEKHEQS